MTDTQATFQPVNQVMQQSAPTDAELQYQPGGPPVYALAIKNKQNESREAYITQYEESPCARFPHMASCNCEINSQVAIREISLIEVYQGIFMGPFQSAFKIRELIDLGVTHILNVTCKSYTPQKKLFKYLDIPIHDEPNEDAKKYFRISNRFINECLSEGGKVLVQSVEGRSRAPAFILAYMINRDRVKLKDCLNSMRMYVPEAEPNTGFMAQLAQYDLELLQINE